MKSLLKIVLLVIVIYTIQCVAYGQRTVAPIHVYMHVSSTQPDAEDQLRLALNKRRDVRRVARKEDADVVLKVIVHKNITVSGRYVESWNFAYVSTVRTLACEDAEHVIAFRLDSAIQTSELAKECELIIEDLDVRILNPIRDQMSQIRRGR